MEPIQNSLLESREKQAKDRFFIIPKELLNFKVCGKSLIPKLIDDPAEVKELYEIWMNSIGKTKRDIKESFQEHEDHTNYKMIRGYFHILSGLSRFKKKFEGAEKIREFLFSFGPVLSEDEREKVIQRAKMVFGTDFSPEMMWSDIDDRLILEEFENISLEDTVKIYNLALIVGIALLAHRIKLKTTNTGSILRLAKRLKLMYEVDQQGLIHIFGPESLISESQRYKLQIAKCFCKIIKQKNSTVWVETPKGCFKFSPEYLRYIPAIEVSEAYDSKIEEDISKLIKDALPYASIQREPDAFVTSAGVFIPDFKISTKRKDLFIEIVGFWTKEYIERKLAKLSDFKKDILLIVSEENSLDVKQKLPQGSNVIYFRREIPYLEILKKIKEFVGPEESNDLNIKTDRIEANDHEEKLKNIEAQLKDGMDFSVASAIIRAQGLDVGRTLSKLGFEIVWELLLPPNGKIVRKQTRSAT